MQFLNNNPHFCADPQMRTHIFPLRVELKPVNQRVPKAEVGMMHCWMDSDQKYAPILFIKYVNKCFGPAMRVLKMSATFL